jgi:hypothetical protein
VRKVWRRDMTTHRLSSSLHRIDTPHHFTASFHITTGSLALGTDDKWCSPGQGAGWAWNTKIKEWLWLPGHGHDGLHGQRFLHHFFSVSLLFAFGRGMGTLFASSALAAANRDDRMEDHSLYPLRFGFWEEGLLQLAAAGAVCVYG